MSSDSEVASVVSGSGDEYAGSAASRSPSPSASDSDQEAPVASTSRTVTKSKAKVDSAPASSILTTEPTSTVSFSDLGLLPELCTACATLGFKAPSEIQRECIPYALEGKDIIGLAQTGSGKTAAFALPILHHLWQDPQGLFAVVLAPTRCVFCLSVSATVVQTSAATARG